MLKLLGSLLIKTQQVFNHCDTWLETAPLCSFAQTLEILGDIMKTFIFFKHFTKQTSSLTRVITKAFSSGLCCHTAYLNKWCVEKELEKDEG